MKITKRNLLVVPLVGILLYVGAALVFSYDRCFAQDGCRYMYDAIGLVAPYVLFLLPLFLLSLVTYFLREESFRAWLHFAYWWVPLSVVLTLAVGSSGGGGGFGVGDIFDQEFVAMTFAGLFFVLSLIIIAVKSYKLRGK